MKTVRIVPRNDGTDARLGCGYRIEAEDGSEIPYVTSCTIRIVPNDIVRAEIEVLVSPEVIKAHPLLGLDTVREAARLHGFDLVERDPGQESSSSDQRLDPDPGGAREKGD